MDYSVDESFGKVEGSGYSGTSITDQMEAAYQNNCVKDVADLLTPERMKVVASQTPDWEEMTPEQLKEALAPGTDRRCQKGLCICEGAAGSVIAERENDAGYLHGTAEVRHSEYHDERHGDGSHGK